MGTWSHQPFGNDTANDWAYRLDESCDLSYIEATLDKVLEAGADYLESSDAEEAVAAIEVLARLLGRGTQFDAYTEKVDVWVKKAIAKPSSALRDKAGHVLQRILSEDSELSELWEDGDGGAEWRHSMEQLHAALSP
jgi:hypothetical protein